MGYKYTNKNNKMAYANKNMKNTNGIRLKKVRSMIRWFAFLFVHQTLFLSTVVAACRGGTNNDFRGYVLELISTDPGVTEIGCRGEGLTGTVPSQLGQLSRLEYLSLGDN